MKKLHYYITGFVSIALLNLILGFTHAEQACSPGYERSTVKNCCVSPYETQCRPLDGSTYCSNGDGEAAIYNSNGDMIESCAIKNARCQSYAPGVAQCVPNGQCDPNAPLTNCIDLKTATNSCGKVQTCGSNQKCSQWQGCVDSSTPEYRFCAPSHPTTNKSYSRYGTLGGYELCPGSCKADGNDDGHLADAICVPGICDDVLRNQRICNGRGNIVNGCGETVDECTSRNQACHATTTTTCECRPKPPVEDQCNNIAGVQETIPSGMTRDSSGNCSAPNPCAGTEFTATPDYVRPDGYISASCSIGGQPGEIWTEAQFWDHGTQKRYTKKDLIGKGDVNFSPMDDYYASMKTNEKNKIICRANADSQICGQKDIHVLRTVCDARGFTASANHATIGQEITFDCHSGAGNGATLWMYEVAMDTPIREKGLTLGVDSFINGYRSVANAGGGLFAGWYFVENTDWNWGRWTNDSNRYKMWWGGYCGVDGKTCVDKGAYDINEKAGTMKWKPQEKGMYFVNCLPKNARGGGAYPIGRDIDQCGSRYIIVDDKPGTDVSVKKTVDKPRFPNTTGEIITWTVNYFNNGDNPAEKVTITDTLPKGLTVNPTIFTNTTSGLFSSIKSGANNQIIWTFAKPIPAKTSGSIILTTRYIGGLQNDKAITNYVVIDTSSPGDLESNNGRKADVIPYLNNLTDVQIIKSVDKQTFPNISGQIITRYLDYRNNGPSVATGVTIVDQLPTGFTYYGTFTPTTILLPGNKIQYNIGDLTVNQTGRIIVQSKYLGGMNNNEQLTNNVGIKTSTLESDYTNNSSKESTKPFSTGNSSLGDYVWIDTNKNGIQDNNEKGMQGVLVRLYSGCTTALPYATTYTSASGYYLFAHLDAGQYKLEFVQPNGYIFTSTKSVGSTTLNDSNANGSGFSECISLPINTNNPSIDAGLIVTPPVSCDSLTMTVSGNTLNYQCTGSSNTNRFELLNSGGIVVYSKTGFNGSVLLGQPGNYVGRCIMDNNVTYKVTNYEFTQSTACVYKQSKNGDVCANQQNLPTAIKPFNIYEMLVFPSPIELCTPVQLSDSSYVCVDAPANTQIWIKDPNSCTKPVSYNQLKLGDKVWIDTNKNGIQDSGETGLAGVTVELSMCTGTAIIKTTTTDSLGNYLFDGLVSNNYKLRFIVPNAYSFTNKYVGTNRLIDSNVSTSGYTECINLVGDDLTIDAGVVVGCPSGQYHPDNSPTGICCNNGQGWNGVSCVSTCPSGQYHPDNSPTGICCNNGSVWENGVCKNTNVCTNPPCSGGPYCPWETPEFRSGPNGSKCCPIGSTYNSANNTCSTTCSSGLTKCADGTCRQNLASCASELVCEWSDPPTVNIGEYYPTFWGFKSDSDYVNNLTESCSSEADNGRIIKGSVDCSAVVKNGNGQVIENDLVKCYGNNGSPIAKNLFNNVYFKPSLGVAQSRFENRDGLMIYNADNNYRSALGEYSFTISVKGYKVCEYKVTSVGGSSTITKNETYVAAPDVTCQSNFVVSDSYISSKNGSLSNVSKGLSNFYNIGGGKVTVDVSNSISGNYSNTANLSYIFGDFIAKYRKLANDNGKVPNKEIYLNKLGGSKQYTSLFTAGVTLDRDKIVGIPENSMIVVNGTLTIRANSEFCNLDTIPVINGAILAQKVILVDTNGQSLKNNDLSKSYWCKNGNIKVNGLLVASNTQSNDAPYLSARSTVGKGRFGLPTEKKNEAIYNGGSLILQSKPSLWLSLPPGAGELFNTLNVSRAK